MHLKLMLFFLNIYRKGSQKESLQYPATLYNDIVMLTEAVKAPYLKAFEPRPIKTPKESTIQ